MSSTRTRGSRPRLVAIGDLVLDIVITPAAAVASGTDVPGTVSFRAGGSAANTCRAFSRLGGAATFIGAVGHDGWGRRLVAALRADGVQVRASRAGGATARLAVIVAARGERSFITQRGAADLLRPAHLEPAWFRQTDVLHVPAYSLLNEPLSSAVLAAVPWARAAGALVSLDLASRAPLLARGREEARARIGELAPDVILANADEAAALAGPRASNELLELAPVVVIKEGAAGSRVAWRSLRTGRDVLELAVATKPLHVTDTTGAGDAFDAGFLFHVAATGPTDELRRSQLLRRAAVAGQRAAARLLTGSRPELSI